MTDFAELYKKYAPDVYRFALYLSGEKSEAEDITSDTFVRAWTSSEAIRVATVKAYLAEEISEHRTERRDARSGG